MMTHCYKTIHLYTSDGRALTSLTSGDPTISLPNEIHLLVDGTVRACHADLGDEDYPDLYVFCCVYKMSEAAVLAQ